MQVPLLLATFVLMLLFSGIIFGWTDMQLVMEREGVYCTANCANHGGASNSSRATFNEVKYNLIVTIGEVRGTACVRRERLAAARVRPGPGVLPVMVCSTGSFACMGAIGARGGGCVP